MNKILKKINDIPKNVKIIIISIFLIVALIISYLIIKNITKEEKPEPVIKYNNSADILKDQDINGLLIHDISLQIIDGQSNFRAKATNKTDKNIDFEGLELTFYDEKGELGKVRVFQTRTIVPNETIDLVNYTDMDFTKASSVKYEIVSE